MNSTLTQNLTANSSYFALVSNDKGWICNVCKKVLQTEKGLKLHKNHCIKKNQNENLSQSNVTHENNNLHCEESLNCITVNTDSNVNSNEDSFGKLLSKLKRRVPILKRIPKGARKVTAEKLSHRISDCIRTNSREARINLMLFSYVCLRLPEKENGRVW